MNSEAEANETGTHDDTQKKTTSSDDDGHDTNLNRQANKGSEQNESSAQQIDPEAKPKRKRRRKRSRSSSTGTDANAGQSSLAAENPEKVLAETNSSPARRTLYGGRKRIIPTGSAQRETQYEDE